LSSGTVIEPLIQLQLGTQAGLGLWRQRQAGDLRA
jgi:hypothetical protein